VSLHSSLLRRENYGSSLGRATWLFNLDIKWGPVFSWTFRLLHYVAIGEQDLFPSARCRMRKWHLCGTCSCTPVLL